MTDVLNLPTEFSVDSAVTASAIKDLLAGTSFGDRIQCSRRGDMFGTSMVHTFRVDPGGIPVYVWSSGEIALWRLLLSIGGRDEVDLSQVVAYCSGDLVLARNIAIVFERAMGL